MEPSEAAEACHSNRALRRQFASSESLVGTRNPGSVNAEPDGPNAWMVCHA